MEISEAIEEVKRREPRLLMSFSCGADAIAMFLRLLERDEFDMTQGVYFYYWIIPGVPWIDEWIEYFTSRYGIRLIQLPNPIYIEDRASAFLQPPDTAWAIAELQKTRHGYYRNEKAFLESVVKQSEGLSDDTLTAIGVKQGDSPMRRMQIRKHGLLSLNQKKWYPIGDFENRDALDIIKRHNVKLPYDYELFGNSFENIDYRFSSVIRERCPETYRILKEHYPMIDMYIERNERYHPEWKAKKGVFYRKLPVLEPRVEI